MNPETPQSSCEATDRYHGFSLSSVCWGYRDIFEKAIEELLSSGMLGEDRREVTESFFGLLKHADQSCYDHVLRRFLGAINPRTEWLLDLPGIFSDIVELGHEYAAERPHHGVTFFEILGRGGFGDSPAEVRHCLSQARRLRDIDVDLSLAFLKGYQRLSDRLDLRAIDLYVEAGLASFARNRRAGLAFMEGALESSETYLRSLTRECRLEDVQIQLEALLKALTGTEVRVEDIGRLDSDDLIERGCHCVSLSDRLYLPARVRQFRHRSRNRSWYRLAAIMSAGALSLNSFSRVHGHRDYVTCMDLAGGDPLSVNLFLLAEWHRVVMRCREQWPGLRRLLDQGLTHEFREGPFAPETTTVLRVAYFADTVVCGPSLADLLEQARGCVNVFQTAKLITPDVRLRLAAQHAELTQSPLPPLSFLPDYLFPLSLSTPPRDGLVADLKQQGRDRASNKDDEGTQADATDAPPGEGHGDMEPDESAGEGIVTACYLYDEWSRDEDDYIRDYCHVYEENVEAPAHVEIPEDILEQGRRLSRVFERLRPDLVRKEKYLQDGDEIDTDRLLRFLVRRRDDPSPRVDFYQRPRINLRDLGVLILMDVSGSTGEVAEDSERIIDVEKRAALVLGQGLHTLGDRFGVFGFNSNGHENCHVLVYKDMDDEWDRQAMARVMAATPANSTRVGPALRHAGWRMQQLECRQRLILVITDGRPMDTGYDPNTRYAQYDVRMACEENERRGIHTFAISTEENSVADMDIMFPGQRFVILSDIRRLPSVLPMLYTRLTVS